MEGSTSYVTLKNDFEVTLNKTGTELIIEAEDQGNGNLFSSRFSNDAIKSMGLDLFENVPELFEGLITAFEGVSEDTSVKLGQDGKLVLIQKVKIGKSEKVFNFPIPLKLVEMDQITKIEKQMRKLFREVEGLKKENQQLKERLHIVDYEVVSPEFDASGPFSAHYSISNDKKQITRNSDNEQKLMPLSSKVALSQEKNSKFHVKLEAIEGDFAIGLATRDTLKIKDSALLSGAYSYSQGALYENGTRTGSLQFFRGTSPIVGVLFVPSLSKIVFDVNGTYIGTVRIDSSHQKLDLYPFVSISGYGVTKGKVSFI